MQCALLTVQKKRAAALTPSANQGAGASLENTLDVPSRDAHQGAGAVRQGEAQSPNAALMPLVK